MKIGIIGAGPAGISCAVQLKRYGISPLIFEKNKISGAVNEAYKIYNFLGFPEGIEGKKFAKRLEETVKKFSLKIIFDEIKILDYKNNKFYLTGKKSYKFDILIIASGTYPKKFYGFDDFVFLHEIKNKKNKEIGIIGGSDVAFDYALSLKKEKNVFILHRSKTPKAIEHLKKLVFKNKNIHYLNNCQIKKIEKVNNKIKLFYKRNGKENFLLLDYLLNATGRSPEKGYYSENFKNRERELIGKGFLYLIGDVKHPNYRQISIAQGDGILTAQKIYEKIKRNENN